MLFTLTRQKDLVGTEQSFGESHVRVERILENDLVDLRLATRSNALLQNSETVLSPAASVRGSADNSSLFDSPNER